MLQSVSTIEIEAPERTSDPNDRASVEEAAYQAEMLQRQQTRAAKSTVPPSGDGDCACGCGNPVDPRRLALGYGLALECAERRERVQ